MRKSVYRLSGYRITEYETGQLWWEEHSGLGAEHGGKCYLYKGLLIIGESAREEISSLIDEFADELKRLPSWEKSSHYCLISGLLALSGPHRPWGILLGLALAISQVGEFTGEREHEEEDRHHERHHGKEHEEKH